MRYDKATARRGEAYVVDLRGKKGASAAPSRMTATLARVRDARRGAGNGTGLSALAKADVTAGTKRKLKKKPAGRRPTAGRWGPGEPGMAH